MTGHPGRLLVGTSGWSYDGWRGDFYPAHLPRSEELVHLAGRTTSTEINASFYRLQSPDRYRHWRDRTPADHVFAVKGSRYITHIRRLRDPRPALANLLSSGPLALGSKLAVLLWQLPATLRFDEETLATFLATLPRTSRAAARLASEHDRPAGVEVLTRSEGGVGHWRHAVEPRHPSFRDDAAAALLHAHGVATVWSDSPRRWPEFDSNTADFRYVRLHGHSDLYASRYSDRSLDRWAARCDRWLSAGQDVHVYFDNDARGHAPHDAMRLLDRFATGDPPGRVSATQAGTVRP